MNVIDFIKEKKARLAQKKVDIFEIVHPNIREYVDEALNLARKNQLISWIIDLKKLHLHEEIAISNLSQEAVHCYQQIIPHLNEIIFIGDWYHISQEKIDQFAELTEDTQWIHTDPVRANKESPFKSTIAHGFLTLSMIPKLISSKTESTNLYTNAKMIINIGLNKVRYPYPLKSNSKIRASKKIVHILPTRRGLEITEEITIEIEGVKRPACVAEAIIMLIY